MQRLGTVGTLQIELALFRQIRRFNQQEPSCIGQVAGKVSPIGGSRIEHRDVDRIASALAPLRGDVEQPDRLYFIAKQFDPRR